MLKKLLKHELYATGKILLPLYGITLIISLVNRILININTLSGPIKIIQSFAIMAYVISIIATVFVTFVIIILRFYKNLMSDEGYLMFTLPVKPSQLINSKLIVSLIWNIVSVIVVIAALTILLISPERMDTLKGFLDLIISTIKNSFGDNFIILTIETIIITILSLIQQILLIYVSIAVGSLFNGHRVLGSFASYIGINTVVQIFVTFIMFGGAYIMGSSIEELESIPHLVLPISIVIILIFSTIYYVTTNYIFNKKLNLE